MIQVIAFYLFAALAIAAGAFTILSRNPVHSVLWLIVAFFNAAGLMVLCGAEFIAMLLVIVYVGAVAVLFLFVVMMLDIDFAALRAGDAAQPTLGFGVSRLLGRVAGDLSDQEANELSIALANIWNMESAQLMGMGEAGVMDAATAAEEQKFIKVLGGE